MKKPKIYVTEYGEKILKRWRIIGIIALFAIFPVILDKLVFANNFKTFLSNEQWSGFLGGYIGALFGAAATIYAVNRQIKYNEEIRKQSEIKKIRPYLYFKVNSRVTKNNDLEVKGTLYNYGQQAACNILLYEVFKPYEGETEITDKTLWNDYVSIGANQSLDIIINFSLERRPSLMFFKFYDIAGNNYLQSIEIGNTTAIDVLGNPNAEIKLIDSFITKEPKMQVI